MSRYDDVRAQLRASPRSWLVTGGAGFIGSHLVETLLGLGQRVRVLDNFVTGKRANLFDRAALIEGDVADAATSSAAVQGVDVVLHQAALGSVPRSLKDPAATHRANVDGFVALALAAKSAGVARFVYASSSSVYGDAPELPKREDRIGRPLSPYAVSKLVDELYAKNYQDSFGLEMIGLRYFNVFGPRQDPEGDYAAVIPRWFAALLRGDVCTINGDGETSRDFCYVENAVQANLLAACAPSPSTNEVYNVACGARTTLNELFELIRARAGVTSTPRHAELRDGDVRHSLADIDKARARLGYEPTHDVARGLDAAYAWYAAAPSSH